MPATLIISYELHPPPSTSAPTISSSTTTHEFPLELASTESVNNSASEAEVHYAALRDTIAQAKETIGRELTAWRDAVGDGEKEKTGGKVVDEDTEDAGEEEEVEEQEKS
ncbi:hypothetical protein K439DRAFT_984135 [Ramaria rubella]|nr:hypothetical protein K439DRAFT_984135 [Ramaria rubella]